MTNNPNSPFWGTGSWSSSQTFTGFTHLTPTPMPQGTPQPAAPVPEPVQTEPGYENGVYVGMPADFYFDHQPYASSFEAHRQMKRAHNASHRPGPAWLPADELKLVDNLWKEWYGEPWPGPQGWDYNQLNVDALETVPLRRKEMPPFKINYDTYAEIKLRLLGTAISVKGHPFFVKHIRKAENGKFHLALSDGEKMHQVVYDDLIDLRSIPALYVTHSSTSGWLCRTPGRVYQQGMNRNNTQLRSADGAAAICNMEGLSIVKSIRGRQVRKWNETLSSLLIGGEINNLRLSDDVALRSKSGKILACYRGRALGRVQGDEIVLYDEDDLLQEWIEKPVKEAGLQMAA